MFLLNDIILINLCVFAKIFSEMADIHNTFLLQISMLNSTKGSVVGIGCFIVFISNYLLNPMPMVL